MSMNDFTSKQNNKANVYELQQYLRYISQNSGLIPLINPDGIYGIETFEAVMALQKQLGLPATGEVDFLTWQMILELYNELYEENRLPSPIYVFPLEIPYFKQGDAFDEIYVLQVMLKRLSKIYGNIDDVDITGEFDVKTMNAVNSFKECCEMDSDGRVDRRLWNMIAETYSAFTYND